MSRVGGKYFIPLQDSKGGREKKLEQTGSWRGRRKCLYEKKGRANLLMPYETTGLLGGAKEG